MRETFEIAGIETAGGSQVYLVLRIHSRQMADLGMV